MVILVCDSPFHIGIFNTENNLESDFYSLLLNCRYTKNIEISGCAKENLHDFKDSKALIDKKINPLQINPPGSQSKMANRRKALKSLDFQRFLFLSKFQIGAEYRGGEGVNMGQMPP